MENIDPRSLWFDTPDTHTLCRAGGNGPAHPSQLYAIKKYVKSGMGLLDYGCGSATTLEALLLNGYNVYSRWMQPTIRREKDILYKGLDIIPKNVKWCKRQWPTQDFQVNKLIHKIDQANKTWDVVYSRHVVDHMKSFEDALDEHCRVAKKLVIITLWVPFSTGDEHEIKNIVDHRGTPEEKLYPNEYTNQYSEKKVMETLHNKIHEGWRLKEITKDVGAEVSGHDIVIVLERDG